MQTHIRALLCSGVVVTSLWAQDANMLPGLIVVAKLDCSARIRGDLANQNRTLRLHDKINQGAEITTDVAAGGRLVLAFSNGAVIRLAPDSVIRIDQLRQSPIGPAVAISELHTEPSSSQTELTLLRGEVIGETPILNANQGSVFVINVRSRKVSVGASNFRISLFPNELPPKAIQVELSPRRFDEEDEGRIHELVDERKNPG